MFSIQAFLSPEDCYNKLMDNPMKRPPYFPAVLIAGGVSISFASIFIKFCYEVPALVIAAFRTGLVAMALLPFFIWRRPKLELKILFLCLLSGIGLALHFAFWISSLKYTSVASSLFILSIYPFITAVLSRFILREKLPATFVAGSLLALAGIAVIFSVDLSSLSLTVGNLLSFAGALALSLYFIPGRVARQKMHIIDYVFVVYSVASIILIPASLMAGYSFTGYSSRSYLYLLLLALLSQGIGHSSFNWALRYLKTGLVSLTTLVEPVGASFLAWLFLKETVSLEKFAGMALVAAGIVMGWLKE